LIAHHAKHKRPITSLEFGGGNWGTDAVLEGLAASFQKLPHLQRFKGQILAAGVLNAILENIYPSIVELNLSSREKVTLTPEALKNLQRLRLELLAIGGGSGVKNGDDLFRHLPPTLRALTKYGSWGVSPNGWQPLGALPCLQEFNGEYVSGNAANAILEVLYHSNIPVSHLKLNLSPLPEEPGVSPVLNADGLRCLSGLKNLKNLKLHVDNQANRQLIASLPQGLVHLMLALPYPDGVNRKDEEAVQKFKQAFKQACMQRCPNLAIDQIKICE
jgi:hypothetical protein